MTHLPKTAQDKQGHTYTVSLLNETDFEQNSEMVQKLVEAYCTRFWGGAWQELLMELDDNGEVVQQYGTEDENGIYENTKQLLDRLGIDPEATQNWPEQLWQMATDGKIQSESGNRIVPYWSGEEAFQVLHGFTAPVIEGGYEGELVVLTDENGEVSGFSAFSCVAAGIGRYLADKRYSYDHLVIDGKERATTFQELLLEQYGGVSRIGVLLDFGLVESKSGKGLSQVLFDLRLKRLLELDAEIIAGRTVKISENEYYGYFHTIGMEIIASAPDNPDRVLFVIPKAELSTR